MAHKVKCPVCEERFYKKDVDFIKKGRRYYHKDCLQKVEDKQDANSLVYKEELFNLIKELFNIDYPTPRIIKQIKSFKNKGYTYFGMKKTLEYFFNLQDNSIKKARGGIGIIPYVYDEASEYYKKIKLSKQSEDTEVESGVEVVRKKAPHKDSVFDKKKVDINNL
ncbi:MAG: hypothetical protein K9K76_07415 [Halanaerobiales bacterium]|nr:hypothetical protein [Halanaerobiales bacterium]